MTMTTETVLFMGIGGCVSGIIFLFGLEQARHKDTSGQLSRVRERLDKCENDRMELRVKVGVLEAGCSLPECPLKNHHKSANQ